MSSAKNNKLVNNKIIPESGYHLALISGVVFIIYLQSVFFGLIFLDDNYIIYEHIPGISNLVEIFRSSYLGYHYYRPIANLSFLLDDLLGKSSTMPYHMTNLFIHLIVSILLYFLLNKLNYDKATSLISALLFAATPIHVNAIGWIAGRADLLAGLFSILALIIFVFITAEFKIRRLIMLSLFILLATLSKETALVFPFLLLIYLLLHSVKSLNFRNGFILISVLSITVIFYFYLRTSLIPNVHIDKFSPLILISNIRMVPETLSKFFLPLGIKALPDFEIFPSISGSILIVIAVIVPVVLKSIDRKIYYFGILWFTAMMIPGMFFRTMSSNGFFYWDCRSYTALIGLAISVAEILKSILKKLPGKYIYLFITIYIIIFILSAFYHLRKYENSIIYWNSVGNDYPERYLPHIQLYSFYSYIENYGKSGSEIIKAVSLEPENINNRVTLINYFIKNKKLTEAYRSVLVGIELSRGNEKLPLLPYFIDLSARLHKTKELDNLIYEASGNKPFLESLKNILDDEAGNLKNEPDSAAIHLIKLRISVTDSLLKSSVNNK